MRHARRKVYLNALALLLAGVFGCAGQAMSAGDENAVKCGVVREALAVQGPAATMSAYLGLATELAAGQDCVDQKRAETACQHFGRALTMAKGMGDLVPAEVAPGIQERMRSLDVARLSLETT